jgi:hypothetical protein
MIGEFIGQGEGSHEGAKARRKHEEENEPQRTQRAQRKKRSMGVSPMAFISYERIGGPCLVEDDQEEI